MCLLGRARAACRPKSNAPTASQRNVEGADTSAAMRGSRNWRQDRRTRAKHHSSLAAQASLFGAEGVSRERSWAGNPAIARALATAVASSFAKSGGASSAALFIAAVAPFRTVLLWFVQRSGEQGDTVRTSTHTSKHSPASKTAARRIKADIRGSALPIARNEETQ